LHESHTNLYVKSTKMYVCHIKWQVYPTNRYVSPIKLHVKFTKLHVCHIKLYVYPTKWL